MEEEMDNNSKKNISVDNNAENNSLKLVEESKIVVSELPEPDNLENTKKTVLITGAASGFGKSAANLFLSEDWKVIATDKNVVNLSQLSARIKKYEMDVTNHQMVRDVVFKILQTENIDVLVNSAGYGQYGLIESLKPSDIEKQFAVNVVGLINVTNAVLPSMRKRKSGRIINISSVAGKTPAVHGMGIYYASKHAVEAISDALILELAEFNINVIRINPELHKTNFDKGVRENFAHSKIDKEYALFKTFEKTFYDAFDKSKGPGKVGETIVKAATDPKPKLHYYPTSSARIYSRMPKIIGESNYRKHILKHFT